MTPDQITSFLQRIELFKGLQINEISILSSQINLKEIADGGYIFIEGTPRNAIYLVIEGQAELFQKSAWGEERTLTVFSPYDFFGEGSLTEDAPHSTNARAKGNCLIGELSASVFHDYGTITLKVFSNIARVISRRMRHANAINLKATAQYESGRTRTEHDLLGNREVPHEYFYGVQTLRAMENFHISGVTLNFYPLFIEAFAQVKMAAALANHELGLLETPIKDAVVQACQEILNGKFHSHFVVDMIQGGAGTSTNMNANEVIANRALEILGHEKGEYKYCHPNNHVNMSQSTNDAYPTAIKIALFNSNTSLIGVLRHLIESFDNKAIEFAHILKMGRTQLQDAVPMTLGQTFKVYANTLREDIDRLNENANLFLEVNMGGTAIGTGICADPLYSDKVVKHLAEVTGHSIVLAEDLVEETQDTGGYVTYSGALKRTVVKLSKICNDLRLLSSGPRAGLNEINLPAMQPGSSIMPGKVNPVIPEVVNQVAFKVIGNDLTVTLAAEAGQLELNVMEPVIVQSLFESIEMLKNAMMTLKIRCIDGITANEQKCREYVERSIGLVTALNPYIGYENCSMVAKEALETNRSVYELVLEKNLLSKEELDRILLPENMIRPTQIPR
ncbi:MAG: aspartate ammonia-lyase [Bacteroidetes bacterium]|nr:aspartate ammonia-lyase [Bacteroidota bacterium]MBU1720197.1 aspartate ammonia-lyase [Bacteroidota bacterium]